MYENGFRKTVSFWTLFIVAKKIDNLTLRTIMKERHRERVLCPECGKELTKGSLVTHHQNQNGVAKGGLVSE